jgi:RNA-directed DNA polymerase
MTGRSTLNSDALWPDRDAAWVRVLDHQRKLHRWAVAEPGRRFDDLFNLVCDRATLLVAWERVATNRGARTAGVDAETRRTVEQRGVGRFLEELRCSLRDGPFRPLPVRERLIPKPDGRSRRLGIPTLRDRVAQMALKAILEPIYEADFYPSSYGYRPGRSAHDAMAEIRHFITRPSTYEWVIEGDIEACFDTVDHQILMELVGQRVGDRKVLRLVRAFLRAGVIEEHGGYAATLTGTPQGGIVSPLLANVYLSELDRYFQHVWETEMSPRWRRQYRRRRSEPLPNYRLIRYSDDFVVLLDGTRADAETVKTEVGEWLAERLGMKLSAEKTLVTHIDDGFDFLGFHTRRVIRNDGRQVVLTYPSKASLEAVKHKIKQATGPNTTSLRLVDVLRTVNPILRGWAAYHRHNAASRTFHYLGHYSWWRMIYWLRRKHRMTWKQLRRRYYGADRIRQDGVVLYNPARTGIRRYRFRGAVIPTPYNVGLIQAHEPGSERWINNTDDTIGRVSELISDRNT